METITTGQQYTAVFSIKESAGSDVVTFVIFRASNGAAVLSGNAQYVAGSSWKVLFTPTVDDVYIAEVFDETLDVKYAESFRAISAGAAGMEETVYTTAQMLDQVNAAISARLKGGAVASYSINGRNIQYMTMPDLLALKRDLVKQLAAEKGGARNYAKFTPAD